MHSIDAPPTHGGRHPVEAMVTDSRGGRMHPHNGNGELSLMDVATALLRARRLILTFAVLGGLAGLAAGLLSPRLYTSAAIIVPQSTENSAASGLALAASQFGIRVPTSGGGWGPPVFVELLRSRSLLEPIALDTVVVAEEGNRRVALADLLEVKASGSALRRERAIAALRRHVTPTENKRLSAVHLSVSTEWPSVSLLLAQRLVREVNKFILEKRRSQAASERQFVEAQASAAERELRAAENRLQSFLQQNAIVTSPQLGFQRDRLQREVTLRQQVYASLAQNREDARIREVRDTPVITILEPPALAVVGEPRNTVKKAVLGGFAGVMIALLLAYPLRALATARRESPERSQEFFQLLDEATPRFLRRPSLRS
jgi:uncharacterized protein involved in exopolysaccharide biosynthesis